MFIKNTTTMPDEEFWRIVTGWIVTTAIFCGSCVIFMVMMYCRMIREDQKRQPRTFKKPRMEDPPFEGDWEDAMVALGIREVQPTDTVTSTAKSVKSGLESVKQMEQATAKSVRAASDSMKTADTASTKSVRSAGPESMKTRNTTTTKSPTMCLKSTATRKPVKLSIKLEKRTVKK